MKCKCKDDAAKEEFITEAVSKDEVYDAWLSRIDRIESTTIGVKRPYNSLDISFMLFPLLDAISYTLYGSSCRKYLKELGISHPDIVYKMFRNGQLHNMSNYRLVYDDDEITWGMSSSGGTGGFIPYDSGYASDEFPEYNQPPETVFEYVEFEGGSKHANLQLDRLTALVRHDLQIRKKQDQRKTLNIIIGKRIHGKCPSI